MWVTEVFFLQLDFPRTGITADTRTRTFDIPLPLGLANSVSSLSSRAARPIEETFSRAGERAPERGRHARLCADDVLDQVGDRVDRARVAAHHRIEGVPVLAPVRPLVEEADGDEVVVRHLVRVKGEA